MTALIGCTAEVARPSEQAGTETGNAIVMGLSVEGVDQTETSEIEIDEAWMGLESLTFYNCDSESETAVFNGPFVVDLSINNDLGNVRVKGSSICNVNVKFNVHTEGSQDEPLSGLSLYLSGMRADHLPFEVRSRQILAFNQPLEPIELSEGNNDVVLRFDPHIWMNNVDIENAEQEDGVVLIDETHNTDCLQDFNENVNQCGNWMDCESMMECQEMMQCMQINSHQESSDMTDWMSSMDEYMSTTPYQGR